MYVHRYIPTTQTLLSGRKESQDETKKLKRTYLSLPWVWVWRETLLRSENTESEIDGKMEVGVSGLGLRRILTLNFLSLPLYPFLQKGQ